MQVLQFKRMKIVRTNSICTSLWLVLGFEIFIRVEANVNIIISVIYIWKINLNVTHFCIYFLSVKETCSETFQKWISGRFLCWKFLHWKIHTQSKCFTKKKKKNPRNMLAYFRVHVGYHTAEYCKNMKDGGYLSSYLVLKL